MGFEHQLWRGRRIGYEEGHSKATVGVHGQRKPLPPEQCTGCSSYDLDVAEDLVELQARQESCHGQPCRTGLAFGVRRLVTGTLATDLNGVDAPGQFCPPIGGDLER